MSGSTRPSRETAGLSVRIILEDGPADGQELTLNDPRDIIFVLNPELDEDSFFWDDLYPTSELPAPLVYRRTMVSDGVGIYTWDGDEAASGPSGEY